MPTGTSRPFPASSLRVQAPVAMTTMSASKRPWLVSTPTTRSPAVASWSTSTSSRTSAPSARAPAARAATTVGVLIWASLAQKLAPSTSGRIGPTRRRTSAPSMSSMSRPSRSASLDELLEHAALRRGVEVDQPALGAELERHGQVLGQLVVQAPPGQRDLEGPARVAAVEPHEAGVAARTRRTRSAPAPAGSPPALPERRSTPWPCRPDRHRRRRSDASRCAPPPSSDAIASRSVRSALMSPACAGSCASCCW